MVCTSEWLRNICVCLGGACAHFQGHSVWRVTSRVWSASIGFQVVVNVMVVLLAVVATFLCGSQGPGACWVIFVGYIISSYALFYFLLAMDVFYDRNAAGELSLACCSLFCTHFCLSKLNALSVSVLLLCLWKSSCRCSRRCVGYLPLPLSFFFFVDYREFRMAVLAVFVLSTIFCVPRLGGLLSSTRLLTRRQRSPRWCCVSLPSLSSIISLLSLEDIKCEYMGI